MISQFSRDLQLIDAILVACAGKESGPKASHGSNDLPLGFEHFAECVSYLNMLYIQISYIK